MEVSLRLSSTRPPRSVMRVAATSAVIFSKVSASLAMAPVMVRSPCSEPHRIVSAFRLPVWQVFAVGENDPVAHHAFAVVGEIQAW